MNRVAVILWFLLMPFVAGGGSEPCVRKDSVKIMTPDLDALRRPSEVERFVNIDGAKSDVSCLDKNGISVIGPISNKELADLVATVRSIWPPQTVIRVIASSDVAEVQTGVRCGQTLSASGLILALRHYRFDGREYWAPIAIEIWVS